MASNIIRGKGKLYELNGSKVISTVTYQIHEEKSSMGRAFKKWWGELTIDDGIRIQDGDKYIIELEDNRKGRCSLRRRVNKAVILVPPRFFFLLQGTSPLV